MRIVSRKTVLGYSAAIVALALATGAQAQQRTFNVPAQEAVRAIPEFARQANIQIIAPSGELRGVRTPAVRGDLDTREALRLLLQGTDLEVASDDGRVIALRRRVTGAQANVASSEGATTLEDVVVTGSLIRGVNPMAPVDIYTREQIEQTGASTLEQFARRLPQNLSDNATEAQVGVAGNNVGLQVPGGTSQTRGSAFNLRGLGSTGTLTLVDGRRVSGAGAGGGFVDISLLPLSAVDRVEILSDGASALYGSDAIGGVVNVVLRNDYTGAETSLRSGYATRGGGEELVGSQLLGVSWTSGSVMGGYEYRQTDEITWSQRDFLPAATENWLTPRERSHKGLLSFQQALSSAVRVSARAMYGERDVASVFATTTNTPVISDSDLGATEYSAMLSAEADLGRGWRGIVGGSYSRVEESIDLSQVFTTLDFISTSSSDLRNDLISLDAKIDGPILSIPGGDVRAAIYSEYREQEYQRLNQFLDGSPLSADQAANRTVRSVAAELFVPLVGAQNSRLGIRRLELSLAGRYDDYSDFGSTANPRLGILWSPASDLNIRGTWSTAFHAPTLNLLIPNRIYIVSDMPDPAAADGITRTLSDNSAGTRALNAETAETFSLGFDWTPSFIPRLRTRATYYRIDYDGRISTPPFPGGLSSNVYQPGAENLQFLLTRNPPLSQVQAYYACTPAPCRILGAATRPPETIEAILDTRARNLAATRQRGLDLSANYSIPISLGEINLGIAGTYVFENNYFVLPDSEAIEIRNKYALPVDLRLNGSIGITAGGFSGSLLINYVDGYRNDRFVPNERIKAWTTADLAVSYRVEDGPSALNGTTFSLSVQNLTDERPPFARAALADIQATYDPANASATGRFVSLQIRKNW